MFASGTGSMRGPRVKTPLLLLLLLLLAALTKTVLCDDGDAAVDDVAEATEILTEEAEAEVVQENPGAGGGGGDTEISETIPTTTDDSPTAAPDPSLPDGYIESPVEDDHGSGLRSLPSLDDVPTDATLGPYSTGPGDTSPQGGEQGLSLIIILIPVVLVVLIISMIVCGIFINRRWNEKARNQELRKEDPYLDGSSTEKVPMPMFEEDVPSVLELEMEELDQWMKNDGETAKDSTLA